VKPVAIVDAAVVCALGQSRDELLDGLKVHQPGFLAHHPGLNHPIFRPDVSPSPVPDFEDDQKVHWLMQAFEQVSHCCRDNEAEQKGVFLGTGLSSVTPRELEEDVYPFVQNGRVDRDAVLSHLNTDGVGPWRHMPARAASAIAERWGAMGPCVTTFSACAAGAEAIAEAARSIGRGEIECALAGGHDAMGHPLGVLSFDVLGALSEASPRPFDSRRDGFRLGEGAALLALQQVETQCKPIAYLIGAGSSVDAWGVTAPHPEGMGAELSMRRALADAGIVPKDVDWINAHATGTPVGDVAEAKAIQRVFGAEVPVSSLKGAFGHVLAAAGAVEAVASIMALQHGFIPGTVGCERVGVPMVDIVTTPRPVRPNVVVSNSFGFGGQNVSLVFASAEWVRV